MLQLSLSVQAGNDHDVNEIFIRCLLFNVSR
jgi:hypothetical protein